MNKNTITFVVCFLLIIVVFCVNVSALGNNDIEKAELEPSKKEYYIDEFSIERLENTSKEHEDNFIYSFDVSKDEKCAVLFDDATVVVFNSDATVENILKFNDDIFEVRTPSKTIIRWNEDTLELIMSYDVMCTFTSDGEIIDINGYETELHSSPQTNELTVNKNTYAIKYSNPFIHFLGGERYDLLIRTNNNNEEQILFSTQRALPNVTVFVFVIIIAIITFVIFVLFKKKKKKSKN